MGGIVSFRGNKSIGVSYKYITPTVLICTFIELVKNKTWFLNLSRIRRFLIIMLRNIIKYQK